jgi:cystathionine beta-lyase
MASAFKVEADIMDAADSHIREVAIFDMVTEYLHSRELYDAEKLLKEQRGKVLHSTSLGRSNSTDHMTTTTTSTSNNQEESVANMPRTRLEDLIEKSFVTDFLSGNKDEGNTSLLGKRSERGSPKLVVDKATALKRRRLATEAGKDIDLNKVDQMTKLVTFEGMPDDPHGSSAVPLYQTATFKQPGATSFGTYDYSRSGNPTRAALERQVAELENGCRGFALSSGMSAMTMVTRVAKAGEEIICSDDSYGGTYRLLARITARQGISVRYVDLEGDKGVENLRREMRPNTKLVMIETPTNPFQRICDLKGLAEVAHDHGALVSVDNTIMSPLLQNPLDLGVDIVCHSATKFISGHSDCMAGVVVVKDEKLAEEIYFYQNAEGNALAPFDCWLLLRGIKTMGIRVYEQQRNAVRIANFLKDHPQVKQVFYSGLPSHSNYHIHSRQATGGGSVVSFTTGDYELSKHIVTATKLFKVTVSFGSVDSRIELPGAMSHASIPAEVRAAREFPEDIIRMSIGIEHCDDLLTDLSSAFQSYNKPVTVKEEV